jgi:CHAD domain-containing protein
MARAREVEKLDCDQPFALAAARVIDVRADEVLEHAGRALDLGDIEGVHDMRVATRRLQAAMEVFRPCFPRKRHRAALKQVKGLADALGERRDPDVSIEMLVSFSVEVEARARSGVAVLIEHFRREQVAANERLAPLVTKERLRRLRADLAELTSSARDLATGKVSRS